MQKIMLDKERKWHLTTRGVIEYSKLGYGTVADLIEGNNKKLKQIAQVIDKKQFAEIRKIATRVNTAKTQAEEQKAREDLGMLAIEYGIDMDILSVKLDPDQAIALLKIGLNGARGKDETPLTDDDVFELIDKAEKNPKSTVSPVNFDEVVYDLVLSTKAPELANSLKGAVPLGGNQAKKNG